jgi:hypothetical protein
MKTAKYHKTVSPAVVDPLAAWALVKRRLDRMTKEESLQSFVDAGIFTKKGNPTKHYRGVFVKAKASFASNAK